MNEISNSMWIVEIKKKNRLENWVFAGNKYKL